MITCPHLPACPGCPRFGAAEPAPLATAELRELCERHGVQLELSVGKRHGFRQRARLSVRGRVGAPKIGIFAEGSHRVVDIPSCQIHHPLINTVALALKASMRELSISCYSDAAHAGLVRALQVVVERSSQTAQVVLVCNASQPGSAMPLLDSLRTRLGPRLHSLWWNGNPALTNVILGPLFERVAGPEFVVENLNGARVYFPPAAFGQNNLDLFDSMLSSICDMVPPDRQVVELYAGCGGIGLGLVARARSLTFNEIGAASLSGLDRGLSDLPPEQRQRVRVVRGSAEAASSEIHNDSVLIVDPPRKGLEPALLAALGVSLPERVIYVSCGLGSFLRDAQVLSSQGLSLTSVTAYDLFPYTSHIETLACFTRRVPT